MKTLKVQVFEEEMKQTSKALIEIDREFELA